MTQEPDYKRATEATNAWVKSTALSPDSTKIYREFGKQIPTILHALKLADKVTDVVMIPRDEFDRIILRLNIIKEGNCYNSRIDANSALAILQKHGEKK
jgi:hypothetical protein